jgi:hypothetical protein
MPSSVIEQSYARNYFRLVANLELAIALHVWSVTFFEFIETLRY